VQTQTMKDRLSVLDSLNTNTPYSTSPLITREKSRGTNWIQGPGGAEVWGWQ
jgi:hypothetical protein